LKVRGMAQAVTDLFEQGAPPVEAAVRSCLNCSKLS